MLNIPAELDFKIVFQILGTFEAFSAWKGARFFKADSRADFGVEMVEKFDNDTFGKLCDNLKNGPNKWKALLRLCVWMCKGAISGAHGKMKRGARICWWKFARGCHRFLAFILRYTPLVTIPLLSFSYINQWWCKQDSFLKGEYVFWFIAGKLICYLICLLLAISLKRHINVKVTVSDNGNILSDETGTAKQ